MKNFRSKCKGASSVSVFPVVPTVNSQALYLPMPMFYVSRRSSKLKLAKSKHYVLSANCVLYGDCITSFAPCITLSDVPLPQHLTLHVSVHASICIAICIGIGTGGGGGGGPGGAPSAEPKTPPSRVAPLPAPSRLSQKLRNRWYAGRQDPRACPRPEEEGEPPPPAVYSGLHM